MAWTERYANFDLGTGANDGTSEANAWKTPAAVIAGVASGQRVNIKRQAAAYDLTATVNFNVSGTATAPIWYRAYTTTIGDGGIWECAYNTGGVANLTFSGDHNYVEGVYFKPGASTNLNAFNISGAASWAIRCKWDPRDICGVGNCFRCYGIVRAGRLVFGGVGESRQIVESLFKRVSTTGESYMTSADVFAGSLMVENCVFVGAGNSGESGLFIDRGDENRGISVIGSRFYNFDSGLVLDEEPNNVSKTIVVKRNLFDTMAAYGVKRTNTYGGYIRLAGNYYRACTSGFTNYPVESEIHPNTSLSADPFVDSASADFNINNDAGGGAVLRAVSFDMDPTV